jgi:uncharacterized protein (TIGR03435 family)
MTPGLAFGVDLLGASLVRPLGLVAVAWLVLRVFRVRHPASRHAVWTAVLIGMLLLPIVSVVAPHWTLPVLPWQQSAVVSTPSPGPSTIARSDAATGVSSPIQTDQQAASTSLAAFAWPSSDALIVWSYSAGLVAMLTYRLMGWALLRRVVSRSKLLRPDCLRESADVVTPVAVGVWRPAVILPAGWRTWSAHTRRAVLAHEFAHLRRGDTVVAALARFVKCVFWFHPVAWWVSRQTSDLAELACDAVALQRVGDPAGYSRVLVAFAQAVNRSGQRVALPGLAMASGSRIDERVDQVFEMSGGTMRKLTRPGILLAAIGLPALCVAATVVLGARAGLQPRQAAGSQDPASVQQKYDVVSIKPCAGLPPPGTGRGQNPRYPAVSPGYAQWLCVTLAELANQAYAGEDYPLLNSANRRDPDYAAVIRGGPAWVYDDRFAIEVKAGSGADRVALTGPMLRAMLEDRFQLKLRPATEQQSMYALTVAKGGLKLTPTPPGDCWVRPPGATPRTPPPPGFEGKPSCGTMNGAPVNGNQRLNLTGMTLPGLAGFLSNMLDHYVLDQTKVAGMFNIPLEYAPDEHTRGFGTDRPPKPGGTPVAVAPQVPGGPSIFKALEALGLKVDPTKGPAEYLLIDRVERPKPNSPAADALPPARAAGAGAR